jgi:hypothetical protein
MEHPVCRHLSTLLLNSCLASSCRGYVLRDSVPPLSLFSAGAPLRRVQLPREARRQRRDDGLLDLELVVGAAVHVTGYPI